MALTSDLQHGRAEVEPCDIGCLAREEECDVTRATADIQCGVARTYGGKPDETSLPKPVHAERLEVVNAVVIGRHRGEQVFDALSPGGTGLVVLARHEPIISRPE